MNHPTHIRTTGARYLFSILLLYRRTRKVVIQLLLSLLQRLLRVAADGKKIKTGKQSVFTLEKRKKKIRRISGIEISETRDRFARTLFCNTWKIENPRRTTRRTIYRKDGNAHTYVRNEAKEAGEKNFHEN